MSIARSRREGDVEVESNLELCVRIMYDGYRYE